MIKKDTKKINSIKNTLLKNDLMKDGGEANFDRTLRPKLLDDYVGQEKTVEQLKVFIQATKKRKEPLDHVLFFVVDILREESTLFVPNKSVKKVAEKSFGVNVSDNSVLLPGVVSRKKQIIPNLRI